MKITHNTFAAYVAALKANLSGWYVLLALLLLSVLMSGCEDVAVCPGPEEACATEVTAVGVQCSYGAFNTIWFKTEDGRYLQPWVNESAVEAVVTGQKYRIGFRLTERDERYYNIATCKVAVPDADAIVVTCLSAVSNT